MLEKAGNYSNESDLIDGMRSGVPEAFRFLVEKYQDKVIRTSRGFVHSYADAEDIAQEVFIEVFHSVGKFRNESGLSTWIYRIAVNKSINFVRSATRRRIISFFDYTDSGKIVMPNEPAASSDYSPDGDLTKSEQADAVKKAINGLPVKQRTAFVLSKYDDLNYQEIAEIMDTTIPSVESLLFRAKQNLQKRLYNFYKKNIL